MIFWRLSAHNIYQGDSQWSLPRFPDGVFDKSGHPRPLFFDLPNSLRPPTPVNAVFSRLALGTDSRHLVGRVTEGVQCAEDDRLSVTSFSRLVSQSVRALTLASFTGTWYHTAIPACQAR